MPFKCDICRATMTDGNVLVDEEDYSKKDEINWLAVSCRECTAALERRRVGEKLHNLWELAWIRNNSLWLLAPVLAGLIEGKPKKWSGAAVGQFYKLLVTAHPKAAEDPIDRGSRS